VASSIARSGRRLATVSAAAPRLWKARAVSRRSPRAQQQHARLGETAEDVEGELDCDAGHADLSLGDGRVGAHMLCGLERLLENAVEHRAGRAARLRVRIRLLHLAEDLGLAEHLRVEPGGDLQQMLHRLAAVETQAIFSNSAGSKPLAGTEGRLDAGRGLAVGGHAIKIPRGCTCSAS